MRTASRQMLVTSAVLSALALTAGCGTADPQNTAAADATAPTGAGAAKAGTGGKETSASPSAPSPSASTSASPSGSATPSATAAGAATTKAAPAADTTAAAPAGADDKGAAPSKPDFPVPADVGNATQLITVKASGSYATVTAWAKGASGWKAQFSTASGRVGSNGVTDGATRRQSTYTTPTGTYTMTEGFGVEAGGTAMPYTVVGRTHWWVQDPESKFYNQMHTEAGADFPLTESGERGSERLINYPTQYAKALVINFNRWPAVPGRGAGIFLHVNGSGATAGCVSVPRSTMDRIMGWVTPAGHPRIAIG
ncbi:L,D-transpeptidase family protein [Streptomyces sp. NBC_00873]|uniref:L,D-transpeptidase family protein n=1 Tax=unclassified Streptomyces TaxID=2593676 RepID=UPI00386BDFDA|nr:L,D-transpeptidase family protein [Streptomyces sp. NBC_00873]WTA42714.1 L,D-transpeptidase family protein [Streptomyces sp. NBC_00842]